MTPTQLQELILLIENTLKADEHRVSVGKKANYDRDALAASLDLAEELKLRFNDTSTRRILVQALMKEFREEFEKLDRAIIEGDGHIKEPKGILSSMTELERELNPYRMARALNLGTLKRVNGNVESVEVFTEQELSSFKDKYGDGQFKKYSEVNDGHEVHTSTHRARTLLLQRHTQTNRRDTLRCNLHKAFRR